MYWADTVVEEIRKRFADKIAAGEELIVRDEKTASGRVHIGSMRGVAIHDEVTKVLNADDVAATFKYEINDNDPMDGIPTYLDRDTFAPYFGHQLNSIPAPDGVSENFAEQYAKEFQGAIAKGGFTPEYYRVSELYSQGKMNDAIVTALNNASLIRDIYRKTSGSDKPEGWLPINMVCEKCGMVLSTKGLSWDGTDVAYVCDTAKGAEGVVGCGFEGKRSPLNGNAKLPWKVEWPAKWMVVGVDIEGAGKDHSTRGGSRDVANYISREVFKYEPPFDIPYEFFLVGGAKMSSSKGRGSAAVDVAELLPTKIFRLALLGTRPMRAINFDAEGATIPTLYDRYDDIAQKYWDGVDDDDARLFVRLHEGDAPETFYRMRFSEVAFVSQMPHINLLTEAEKAKGNALTEYEKAELHEREEYARAWLAEHAPEKYVFELQTNTPTATFSDTQIEAFAYIRAYVEEHETLGGEALHQELHAIKERASIEPKELFSGIYQLFLGRDSGPQAGWFLSVLDREYLIERLDMVAR